MDDVKSFLKFRREIRESRPVSERVMDYKEVSIMLPYKKTKEQASRCMDCGTPFCHWGCPLANIIPEINDFIFRGQWGKAVYLLQSENNFPEITGRVCPAICEYACVLGINDEPSPPMHIGGLGSPVTIRENELAVIEYAFKKGIIKPHPPKKRTGKKIAVIGSGPAGLACADQLNKTGHLVTIFEKDNKIGGMMRYGIPDFKLEKWVIDRRLEILKTEGIVFKVNHEIDRKLFDKEIREKFDAVCITIGSREPRDLDIEGRDLKGIYFAMDYLVQSNRRLAGEKIPIPIGIGDLIDAKGKHVVVIGGGDTGSDCIGVANRQGAKSITQIEILPKPPETRTDEMPWPVYPMILKTSTSHEEGCVRKWSVKTKRFIGSNGMVKELLCEENGKEFRLKTDLVIISAGFIHPVHKGIVSCLGIELDSHGNIKVDENYMTSVKGMFSAGDCHRGASLMAWAIMEGRQVAEGINAYIAPPFSAAKNCCEVKKGGTLHNF